MTFYITFFRSPFHNNFVYLKMLGNQHSVDSDAALHTPEWLLVSEQGA